MRNRIRQFLAQNVGKAPPIKASASESGIEICVYDVIDSFWGVSASAIADLLKQAAGADITIRINSPGGDAFEGRAIASQIRSYTGRKRCIVDGVAASAASTIAIAADSVSMAAGSFMMIHRASCLCAGNGDDLRQTAALLDKLDAELAADYARKTKCTLDQAEAWMAAETWFTAQEAIDAGFANAVVDDAAQFAAWNFSAYEHAPAALTNRAPRPSETRPRLASAATNPCVSGCANACTNPCGQPCTNSADNPCCCEAPCMGATAAEDPAQANAAANALQVRAGLERRLRLFQLPA